MIYLNGSDIPEVDWYGNQMVDNDFILIFNAHYEPIQFTLPDERYGKKWKLVVDTHNPDGPVLNYEAGFAITVRHHRAIAQLPAADERPETGSGTQVLGLMPSWSQTGGGPLRGVGCRPCCVLRSR